MHWAARRNALCPEELPPPPPPQHPTIETPPMFGGPLGQGVLWSADQISAQGWVRLLLSGIQLPPLEGGGGGGLGAGGVRGPPKGPCPQNDWPSILGPVD